jgi:hypothetical protein
MSWSNRSHEDLDQHFVAVVASHHNLALGILVWTINGDVLVDAFRAAKIIGPKDGLAFFTRPTREARAGPRRLRRARQAVG